MKSTPEMNNDFSDFKQREGEPSHNSGSLDLKGRLRRLVSRTSQTRSSPVKSVLNNVPERSETPESCVDSSDSCYTTPDRCSTSNSAPSTFMGRAMANAASDALKGLDVSNLSKQAAQGMAPVLTDACTQIIQETESKIDQKIDKMSDEARKIIENLRSVAVEIQQKPIKIQHSLGDNYTAFKNMVMEFIGKIYAPAKQLFDQIYTILEQSLKGLPLENLKIWFSDTIVLTVKKLFSPYTLAFIAIDLIIGLIIKYVPSLSAQSVSFLISVSKTLNLLAHAAWSFSAGFDLGMAMTNYFKNPTVPSDAAVFQGSGDDDYEFVGGIKVLFQTLNAVIFNNTVDSTIYSRFQSAAKGFWNSNSRDLASLLKTITDFVMTHYRKLLGLSSLDKSVWDEIDGYDTQITRMKILLERESWSELIEMDALRLTKTYLQRVSLIVECVEKDRQKGALYNSVVKLKEKISSVLLYMESTIGSPTAERVQPVCIVLRGRPGTGKTVAMSRIVDTLTSSVLSPQERELYVANPYLYVFCRTPENEFWDGYHPSVVTTTIDDFGQERDSIGSKQFLEVIRMLNTNSYHLHMAELSKKKNAYFGSYFVIMTTNMPKEMGVESIIDKEALNRRIDFEVEMSLNPSFVDATGKLDVSKLPSKEYQTSAGEFINLPQYCADANLCQVTGMFVIDKSRLERQTRICTLEELEKAAIDLHNWRKMVHVSNTQRRRENASRYDTYNREPIPMEYVFQSGGSDSNATSYDLDVFDILRNLVLESQTQISHDFPDHDYDSALDAEFIKMIEEVIGERTNAPPLILHFFRKHSAKRNFYSLILCLMYPNFVSDLREPYTSAVQWICRFASFSKDVVTSWDRIDDDALYTEVHRLRNLLAKNIKKLGAQGMGIQRTLREAYRGFKKFVKNSKDLLLKFFEEISKLCVSVFIVSTISMGAVNTLSSLLNVSTPAHSTPFGFPGFLSENKVKITQIYEDYYSEVSKILRDASLSSEEKTILLSELAEVIGVLRSEVAERPQSQSTDKNVYHKTSNAKVASKVKAALEKVRSSKPLDQLQGGQDVTDFYNRIRTHNLYEFSILLTKRTTFSEDVYAKYQGTCLFVEGCIAVMPMHFAHKVLEAYDDSDFSSVEVELRQCKVPGREDKCYKLSASSFAHRCILVYERDELKDTVYVDFSGIVPPRRSLVKYLRTRSEDQTIVGMKHLFLNKEAEENYTHMIVPTVKNQTHVEVLLSEDPFTMLDTVHYVCSTKAGDCGALLISDNERVLDGKILAYHAAYSNVRGHGIGVCIFLEEYEYAKKQLQAEARRSKIGVPLVDVKEELPKEAVLQGGFYHFTKNEPPEVNIFSPSVSKYHPSPANSFWPWPTKRLPAKLRPFTDRQGKIINPYMMALGKYAPPAPALPEMVLREAANRYGDKLFKLEYEHVFKKTLLNYEECVLGLEDIPELGSIVRSTSCGYPYSTKATPLGNNGTTKKSIFGDGVDIDITTPQSVALSKLFYEVDSALLKGQRSKHIFVDTLKDEMRPVSKVKEGKTRLFSAGPILLHLLFRRYFGLFDAFYKKTRINNGSAISVNPYSIEWRHIVDYLCETGALPTQRNFGAIDHKAFDAHESNYIHLLILDVIEEFYTRESPYCDEELAQHRLARKVLWCEILNSRHLWDNSIYEWDASLPSGCTLTATVNTMYNNIAFIYCGLRAMGQELTDNDLKTIALGDDCVFSVSERAKNVLNEFTVPIYMKEIGLDVTREDKNSIGEDSHLLRPLSECTFLKRGFRREPTLSVGWVGPIAMDTIAELPLWWKKSPTQWKDLSNSIQLALDELSLWGKPTFVEFSPPMVRCHVELFGYAPLRTSWRECISFTTSAYEFQY